jgi:hypothetical protein
MIKNTAFLAAMTVFLLAAWLAGELTILARARRARRRAVGPGWGAVIGRDPRRGVSRMTWEERRHAVKLMGFSAPRRRGEETAR